MAVATREYLLAENAVEQSLESEAWEPELALAGQAVIIWCDGGWHARLGDLQKEHGRSPRWTRFRGEHQRSAGEAVTAALMAKRLGW
jgi:hypothetical protein